MIFAMDFDGTMCEYVYPDIGEPIIPAITFALDVQKLNHTLILLTMREGDKLREAVDWLNSYGVYPDICNDNVDALCVEFNNNPRKVFAHAYIDDRNAGSIEQQVTYFRQEYDIPKIHKVEPHNPYQRHETTPIKVGKYIVQVDKKIAHIVQQLNSEGLITRYSCQGDVGHRAYIRFSSSVDLNKALKRLDECRDVSIRAIDRDTNTVRFFLIGGQK